MFIVIRQRPLLIVTILLEAARTDRRQLKLRGRDTLLHYETAQACSEARGTIIICYQSAV